MATTREVYLITFKVPRARDHWGLFFPSTISPNLGKILQVNGAPQLGYKHEVEHYWDKSLSRTPFTLHLLGETDAANIVDAPVTDPHNIPMLVVDDLNRADSFENRANRHPPPRIASGMIPTGTVSQVILALWRDIPGMRRCQEWTSDFIDDLVEQGLLPESALEVRDAVRAARVMPPEA
ncbi:hypothetical protein BDZ97DRAFT_1678839 [Flammula alnicola]|nr:hypothetical protein BDZ97DRAFT_1678839 [Flammula alnicola]